VSDEQRIDVLFQWFDDALMKRSFDDGIYVQEFILMELKWWNNGLEKHANTFIYYCEIFLRQKTVIWEKYKFPKTSDH
jgi:hypothetical protein